MRHPVEVIVFVRDEIREAHARGGDPNPRVLHGRHGARGAELLHVAEPYAERRFDLSLLEA